MPEPWALELPGSVTCSALLGWSVQDPELPSQLSQISTGKQARNLGGEDALAVALCTPHQGRVPCGFQKELLSCGEAPQPTVGPPPPFAATSFLWFLGHSRVCDLPEGLVLVTGLGAFMRLVQGGNFSVGAQCPHLGISC